MIDEAKATIRNAGFLLAQRGFHIVGSILLALVIPRMMGPDNYGRYVLVISLSQWFLVLTDLGSAQVMGRYVPQFRHQGEREKLQKFFSNILTLSLAGGTVGACLYLLFTGFWLADLDFLLLVTLAATLLVRAGSHPFFVLFLGLNQAARWGMGEIFRHWLLLFLVAAGFYLGGLRGALLGLLVTELVVLLIGVGWGKSYYSWAEMRLDLPYLIPYFRFGFIFFIFNLLSSLFSHSGEVLIRLFYPDYVQVSYFGLANNIYLGISFAIPQCTLAFAPLMVTLHARGETKPLTQWIEHVLNWLTVGTLLVIFAVLLLGDDLIPWALGNVYRPVTANLLPLSITLGVQVLANVAILLTIVYDHPKIAVIGAGVKLASIWAFGPFLVSRWGSLGGCLAVLGASVLFAGYLTWRMQRVIPYSLQKWAFEILLGLIFLPLFWLRSSWSVNALLYAAFVIGYLALLLLLRFVSPSEVAMAWRAFRSKGKIFNGPKA